MICAKYTQYNSQLGVGFDANALLTKVYVAGLMRPFSCWLTLN